jgi:putative transposase
MIDRPQRKHPAKGVLFVDEQPTLVFVTVCTRKRVRWLANQAVHSLLVAAWKQAADWHVGHYIIMPDHLHFFAWPGSGQAGLDLWIKIWKSRVSLRYNKLGCKWQPGSFHHRIRAHDSAEARYCYMLMNPIRAGLIDDPALWPFQGEVTRFADWW